GQYRCVAADVGAATMTVLTLADTLSPVVRGATAMEPSGLATPVISQVAGGGTLYLWTVAAMPPGAVYTFTITGAAGVVCAPTGVTNSSYIEASTVCSATQSVQTGGNFVIRAPVANLSVVKGPRRATRRPGGPAG